MPHSFLFANMEEMQADPAYRRPLGTHPFQPLCVAER